MTTSKELKCPFKIAKSQANYSVQIEEPHKQSFLVNGYESGKEYLSRISFSSLRNAWHIYFKGDFNSLFKKICKPGERLTEFRTPIGTQYIIQDQSIMQLILSHFRNQDNGLFCVPDNERIFADGIIKDLYPEEISKITNRETELINSIIFTAESAYVPGLRARVMGFLKQKEVEGYRKQLDQIAGAILDQLSPSEKNACDPAKLAFEFAITVMARLFTGYHTTRENYQKIVSALVTIGKQICSLITQRPPSVKEKTEYHASLQVIRDLIDKSIHSKPTSNLIINLRENGLSEFAIKIYLFFFYLAGTETTSAVTHYLLMQLGKNENRHYQDLIRKEGTDSILLKKCIIEALRLNPAAFILGRALRRDILVTVRDSNQSLIWKKLIRKGHIIINWISGAARNPKLYPDPDTFNPQRYETLPTQLPWYPFANGHHTCPGQFLAKAEMESFVSEILHRFHMQTIPETLPIESKGTFTLHADPDAKIKIKFFEL